MEQSLSSLAFKGSVTEAIFEAKRQKKLFVVYMSGDNAESSNLEMSTWTELSLAEALSKYCILLHISKGSVDAVNLSAIYPQKSAPCITVIGYNGLQLWQNEGYVTADVLASSLEKAWLNLHFQETAATVLTAALAAKKAEQLAPKASSSNLPVQETSSSSDAPSSSVDKHIPYQDAKKITDLETVDENKHLTTKDDNLNVGDSVSPAPKIETISGHAEQASPINAVGEASSSSNAPSSSVDKHIPYQDAKKVTDLETVDENKHLTTKDDNINMGDSVSPAQNIEHISGRAEQASPINVNELPDPVKLEPEDVVNRFKPINVGVESPVQEKNLVDLRSEGSMVNSEEFVDEPKSAVQADTFKESKNDTRALSLDKSDVHLNIRLPDCTYLQEKFSLISTLREVKSYVDENQGTSMRSYDLAIPYPRKVFGIEDLSKTLSELGLRDRQALILVPHSKVTSYRGEGSAFGHQATGINNTGSSNGSAEGYLSFVKRIISYVNPLSYIGSGTNSQTTVHQAQSSMWQHSPNSTLQNIPRNAGPNQSDASSSNGNKKRPASSRFGSNIHTLKHDEDDNRQSKDRNAFWNGNSTEYGGDNDGK